MSKKLLFFIIIFVVIILMISVILNRTGTMNYEDADYTWNAIIGSPDGDELVRGKQIDTISSDINKLICALNKTEQDPETLRAPDDNAPPKLKFIDITGQTVNVEVINDAYLTQRMGTTGAAVFLAVATFTLTEYDNIKSVNFIFEEGDHAAPGLYSRAQFLKDWKVTK